MLNKQKSSALLDTGASINILEENLVPNSAKRSQCNIAIKTISNKMINIKEQVNLNFKIENKKYSADFYVTPLPISEKFQIILGQKFLQNNNCILNFQDNSITIDNQKVKMLNINECSISVLESYKSTYGYLSSKCSLPPFSEKLVSVKLRHMVEGEILLAEAINSEERNFIAGRSIHNNKSQLLIKILNPTDKQINLNKLTKLVTVSPIMHEAQYKEIFHLEESEIGECPEVDLKWDETFKTDHLNQETKEKLLRFLEKNEAVFASSVLDLPGCDIVKHKVDLIDDKPVKKRPYRVPYHLRGEMENQLNMLIDAKILEPSISSFSAPIMLVKKASGEFRLVTDFRGLNTKVVPDTYPIPNISEAIDNLAQGKVYSSLDLMSGFFQQVVEEEDRHKLAVTTPKGLFQFTRTPFGLRTSANSFQRLMSLVLSGLDPFSVGVYIDDIIISSDNIDNHFPKLQKVFDRLIKNKLKLKPSKCTFLTDTIKYLGFVISKGQVFPDNKNIDTINNFKIPKNKTDVQSFLGCINYYRKFIPEISNRSFHLTNLTKDKSNFQWSKEAEQEFNDLKQALVEKPCLSLPDMSKPFHLYTDASNHSIGAVLTQLDEEGFPKPVAFGSKKLKPAETKYSVTEREALAIVFFTNYYRQYLLGKKFYIYTDHAPLTSSLKFKDSFNRIARWTLSLSNFDFELKYLAGKLNKVADFMSRQINNIETVKSNLFMYEKIELNCNLADFDKHQIIEEQNKDEFCLKIKNLIEQENSSFYKNMCFFVDNEGLLKCIDKKGGKLNKEKLVIPQNLTRHILEIMHDSKAACHPGMGKTIYKIRKQYFWPNMIKHIVNWIKSCDKCCERKAHQPKIKAPLQRIPIAEFPFEKVSFDIVGPLPITLKGNKYMVTFIDYFTRFVEAFPIPVADGEHIADVLMQFICRHGVPKVLISDRGLNLLSQGMRKVYEAFGIKKNEVLAYRPSSNGAVERFHRSLSNVLSQIVNERHNDWDNQLPYALLVLRTACHDSTKFSPSFLLYGRELKLPRQFLDEPPPFSYSDELDFANILLKNFHKVYNEVKSNLAKAAELNENRRNKNCKQIQLNIDDLVYWYDPRVKPGLCKKFNKFNKGPYKVVEFISPVVVKIVHTNNQSNVRLAHIEDISLIEKRLDCLANPQEREENSRNLGPTHTSNTQQNNVNTYEWENSNLNEGYFGKLQILPQNRYNLRPRQNGRVTRR